MNGIDVLILTCEHGGNRVPRRDRQLFIPYRRLLQTHRAFDPGALDLARFLARQTRTPLLASTTTRLLVDLNRSPTNPRVFSEVTRPLGRSARQELLQRAHAPHWRSVEELLAQHIDSGRTVLHLAVHSFTPVLRGVRRRCDVGLLYDPQRSLERRLAAAWRLGLLAGTPRLRVRRNYPYRGSDDGLTTAMRRRFAARRYAGLELEINQEWSTRQPRVWRALRQRLLETLRATVLLQPE